VLGRTVGVVVGANDGAAEPAGGFVRTITSSRSSAGGFVRTITSSRSSAGGFVRMPTSSRSFPGGLLCRFLLMPIELDPASGG